MYNSEVINTKLNELQQSLAFDLREYSIEEVQDRIERINSLINLDLYKETSKLGKSKVQIEFKSKQAQTIFESKEVQQFIKNEKIVSKWNCWYFMERYYRILNVEDKEVLYNPNTAQLINQYIFSKLQRSGKPIRKWTPKARQQGETVFSQGVVLQRILFFENVRSLIASAKDDDTFKMSSKMLFALEHLPFWIREFYDSYETGSFYKLTNGSYLDLGYGTQQELGRGGTYTVLHLSEIGSFKFPKKSIDAALLGATHESVWMLQLFEGTANGRGVDNYYHTKTTEIQKRMARGTTSLYLTFFPYCIRRDLFPTETWIRARSDAFSKWKPSLDTIAHAKAAENYINSISDFQVVLGKNWKMDREQMFWYEINRKEAEDENRLNEFLQEYPANLDEAFQHKGNPIVPINIITHYNNKALERLEVADVYKIRGDRGEISEKFFPKSEEVDDNKPIINIKCDWNSSIPASYYELVPIKVDDWNKFDPINKYIIWEHPIIRDDVEYGGFFDPSDGLGINISNDAAFEIWKKGSVDWKDKQVCEFVSPEIPQLNMWPFMLPICTYYSPIYQLLLGIEINNKYELQNAMIARGWSNLCKRYDEGKLGQDLSKIQQYGILTTPSARQAFIEHFMALLLGKHLDISSIELVKEIKDLQKITTISPVLGRTNEKILGDKDNRFMACCIGLYNLHKNQILGHEKKSWEERIKNESSIIELKSASRYGTGGFQITDEYERQFREFDNEGFLVDDRELFDPTREDEDVIVW